MTTRFEVKKGQTAVQGILRSPRFDMAEQDFYVKVAAELGRFGLQPGEISVDIGMKSLTEFRPGETTVACPLFAHWTTVRLKVDRVEIECVDTTQVDTPRIADIVLTTLRTVQTQRDEPYRAFNWSIDLHGVVSGTNPREFISRFLPNKFTTLGSPAGAAAWFYFTDPDRLASLVGIDISNAVPDAVYLRASVSWDASKVVVDSIPDRATSFLDRALESLDLRLGEE